MSTDGMKESNQEVIELKDESISLNALKIVMDFICTGDLHVNEENVFEVLATADHLQVTRVVQQCCDFLKREFIQKRLDLQNYCLLCTVTDRHGLKDLQEAVEHKMASEYKDICESEEFLTHIGADQLFSLLSRDVLSAPSERFVLKSVMQWIKHKKEERMAVAAKVLGAVRLGLVNIRVVIKELDKEEMQRVPEIHMLVYEALMYNFRPFHTSKFAVEKTKPRSISPVLVAIHPTASLKPSTDSEDRSQEGDPCPPKTMARHYFDAETKIWKPMPSVRLGEEIQSCFSAIVVGNHMYLAAQIKQSGRYVYSCSVIYRYHIVNNSWEILGYRDCACEFDSNFINHHCLLRSRIRWGRPPTFPGVQLCSVDHYIYAISESDPPHAQRYNSLANNDWESSGENLSFFNTSSNIKILTVAAVVLKSKIYVIQGCKRPMVVKQIYGIFRKRNYFPFHHRVHRWVDQPALVHCFDPEKNKWKQKASTCHPHFGSCLFVVNDRLCVAGGKISCHISRNRYNMPAPVEVYNEENNTWSVVRQKHIPPNNLGAVEIEGRVYFIINKFPIDSGIRIPPGEVLNHVSLKEWEKLAEVSSEAVLCYLPVL
ncbi:hypothetical protein ACROYT_G000489 [Oculina patagonica]